MHIIEEPIEEEEFYERKVATTILFMYSYACSFLLRSFSIKWIHEFPFFFVRIFDVFM